MVIEKARTNLNRFFFKLKIDDWQLGRKTYLQQWIFTKKLYIIS